MPSAFEIAIGKMRDLGFFQFLLPFMLTAAIFYGLLRKSQIFGKPEDNIAVNGIVALVAAFMVWAYPIIVGVNIEKSMSMFFFQGTISMLIVIAALMIAGMFFPPDLPKFLNEKLKGAGYLIFVVLGLVIGGAVVVSSGLITIFFPNFAAIGIQIPEDTLLTVGVLLLLIITISAIVWIVGRGEGEKKPAGGP